MGKADVVDYVSCCGCDLVQQFPIPADVSSYYEAYPVHQEKTAFYTAVRRKIMAGVYTSPKRWPEKCKILDFGCGDGWYLKWCQEYGHRCVGFEQNPEHAQTLSKKLAIDVFSDFQKLAAQHSDGFDVITLHFVVEHLTDIRSILAGIASLLRKGGQLRFVVPNINSWEYRLFGHKWHSLDAPRHISFVGEPHARGLARDFGLSFGAEHAVGFPNGFGGSLPTVLLGHFSSLFFLLTLPLSVLITRMFPSGNMAYTLYRD